MGLTKSASQVHTAGMSIAKLSTKQILKNNQSRSAPGRLRNMKVLLHNIRSMHNVGAAFRCSDAFGVGELLLSGFTPTPPRPEISKTAIGAEEFVQWRQITNLSRELGHLKNNGYTLIGFEQTTGSIELPDYTPPQDKNICLTFGNEVTGLDEQMFPIIDTFVEIPQYGHKHSLNVSVAVGVALYAMLQKFWT